MNQKKRTGASDKARNMPAFKTREPVFDKQRTILNPPLEITRSMLMGLNMVDETIIVRDEKERKGSVKRGENA
jgi:hypothetical protein